MRLQRKSFGPLQLGISYTDKEQGKAFELHTLHTIYYKVSHTVTPVCEGMKIVSPQQSKCMFVRYSLSLTSMRTSERDELFDGGPIASLHVCSTRNVIVYPSLSTHPEPPCLRPYLFSLISIILFYFTLGTGLPEYPHPHNRC